jgi:hypothetical protein
LNRAAVVVVGLSVSALATTAVRAQVIGQSFTASSRAQSGFIPPDTMGAAGPEHFVELINGRYAVYPKVGANNPNGTRTPIFASTLNAFWSSAGAAHTGNFAFDPRVVYDPYSQRWFALAVDNQRANNSFMLAVSKSSDPLDGWSGFKIDSDSANLRWADFPTLGYNADGVFVAANMFAQTGQTVGQQTTLVAVPKSDLLLPAPTVASRRVFENVAGSTGFSAQPVVNHDNTGGGAPFLAFAGFLRRAELVGPVATATLTTVTTTLPSGNVPLDAPQPGPKPDLHTLDARLSGNVIQQNGTLWGVQTVLHNGRDALHWFKLRASDNAVLQEGFLSDPDLHFYYGSINVNDLGDVVIAASGSSEAQFVSSYAYVGDSAGDTVLGTTTFGEEILLKAGVDDYEVLDGSGRNRWGDYSATVLDPSDPMSFWTIQEFVSGDNQWSTQVTQILVPEPGCLGYASPLVVLALRRRTVFSLSRYSGRGSG